MQIHLDIAQAPDGRLTGTLGRAGDACALPFSGNLELLARLEALTRSNPEAEKDMS